MITHSSSVPAAFLHYQDCLPKHSARPLIFLDIETMGLSHRKDPIILIGMMVISEEGGMLHQFFAQSPAEELMMLQAMIECMPVAGPIFTYNGRSFDIPYINHRLAHHRLDNRIPAYRGVDLMHWAKSVFPEAPRHTLKAIEARLGIHREDTLSGADCVRQYQDYLISQDPQAAEDICLHNFEDILHLAPLLQLYTLLPEKSPLREFPLCLVIDGHPYWLELPICRKDSLAFKGSTLSAEIRNTVYYSGSASLSIYRGELSVTLPVMTFDYPAPGSIFLDCDRIPDFSPLPFNLLTTEEKLKFLIREEDRYHSDALVQIIISLLSLN